MRVSTALTFFTLVLCVYGQQDATPCLPQDDGNIVMITPNCIDPTYGSPIFTNITNETYPLPHKRISGHFHGTEIYFSLYLTPKSQWTGRFFQLVYPTQTADATDHAISFGVESGGFTVQASGSQGYRADAAVAKMARRIAQDYYNVSSTDIYGYIYGGSGGSLKAIGAAERTTGIWDGCLALVQATPQSIPYNWGMRALGGLVFGHHSEKVIEAMQPGSTTQLSSVFNGLEQDIFEEVNALGIPLRAWEDWDAIVGNRTQQDQTMKDIAVPMIQSMDPTYAEDFWTKDGYAGADQSALGDMFRAALVEFDSLIQSVRTDDQGLPSEFVLESMPKNFSDNVGLGYSVMVNNTRQPFSGHLDAETSTVYILSGAANETLSALTQRARVYIDNRWYLAAHTFYRHQVPSHDTGTYGFDILRNAVGDPIFPQRDMLIGPRVSETTTGGATHSGNVTMKTIVMSNLLDFDAFPWHADWYKNQVAKAKHHLQDHYRLYYSENADHAMGRLDAPLTRRVVDFTGMYEQLLRDLSAWVEHGVEPPTPTNYTVENAQIVMPSAALDRKGIQPVVDLLVSGAKRADVALGESVELSVKVQVPHGTGQVVSLEWDAFGNGEYVKKEFKAGADLSFRFSHRYDEPGIYLPGVRAASHREGNAETDIALAWNLDRVRVVVNRCTFIHGCGRLNDCGDSQAYLH